MKLLFDYQAFEMQRIGGVSRSYAKLISHLRDNGVSYKIGLKESDNTYLKLSGLKPLHYTHDKYFGGKKKFKGQRTLSRMLMRATGHGDDYLHINQEYCIKLLKRQQFDIFEPTFFDPYFLPYLNGKPFVLTVHDMIPELMNYDHPQAELKKLLCPLATHIHVPSQNTKDDLIRILGIPSEKITVIPHGGPDTPPKREPILNCPYLLYVGARWSYKNFLPFIKDCAHIFSQCPELHVVCTGESFSNKEMKMLSEMGIEEHVISMQHVPEKQLQSLYQHATAFVYPSAYEGFGIPILEAFANGCPVMLNNASCFPEVAGEAAIYFDITKHGDFADHFLSFYHSEQDVRQALIKRGKDRLQLYSWEKSAQKLTELYQSLV